MINDVNSKLLEIIKTEREAFDTLINADNVLGLNVTSTDIISYLEFSTSNDILNYPIIGNVIISEGDLITILKVIRELVNYEGKYTLYINDDNVGTITYLVKRANSIYKELNINLEIEIDYSKNYNKYLNKLVTIIGSEDFVETASKDFENANKIVF